LFSDTLEARDCSESGADADDISTALDCTVPRTDIDGFSSSSIGLEAATDDVSSGADMLDVKLASTNSYSNTAQHALCKQNNCTTTTDVN